MSEGNSFMLFICLVMSSPLIVMAIENVIIFGKEIKEKVFGKTKNKF